MTCGCAAAPARPARGTLANHAATITTTAPGKTAALAVAELRRGLAGWARRRGQTRRGKTKGRHDHAGPVARRRAGGGRLCHSRHRRQDHDQRQPRHRPALWRLPLLRLAATGADLGTVHVTSAPRIKLRVLNHWDNLDGTVERGYAGRSIWDWWHLPDWKDPRYTDYARANASIGINGVVLNNVNAKADSLTAPYIAKAAALAEQLRPYGIRSISPPNGAPPSRSAA
jgi:alpha-glucuronidase